jgi:hypothetical protein
VEHDDRVGKAPDAIERVGNKRLSNLGIRLDNFSAKKEPRRCMVGPGVVAQSRPGNSLREGTGHKVHLKYKGYFRGFPHHPRRNRLALSGTFRQLLSMQYARLGRCIDAQ